VETHEARVCAVRPRSVEERGSWKQRSSSRGDRGSSRSSNSRRLSTGHCGETLNSLASSLSATGRAGEDQWRLWPCFLR